ncbi:MAG: UDP-N-acetylmuramoyl-tripeptide--D-alanyl-D-alanine ligase, partial [Gammaproteobacteria bacterium]|nr:UDP-N-acetylmuramoyl-tripeptide--D-alanyl-D-alanine ligase [Gammaproteobacteria bacterium]
LLRLRPPHQYAVLEMGTSHPGEIRYLVEMGKPTVSLITNIYPQHLEGFGHIDLIAKEKSEIFAGLSHDGVAIINADEPYAPEWQKKVEHRHWITFGLKNPADVHAKNISISPEGSRFDLFTPIGQQSIFIPLLGPHVVQNALAAAAASMSVGASLKAVAEGLSKVKPVKGRLAPHTLKNGAILIDDTYNAGAPSVENALKLLQQFPKPRLFVMSNMAELGPLAEHYHQSMGEWIVKYGVDQAFLYGDRALLAYTLKSAHGKAHYFETQEELVLALREKLTPSSTVLVKGSRGNKMENIVNELLEPITC